MTKFDFQILPLALEIEVQVINQANILQFERVKTCQIVDEIDHVRTRSFDDTKQIQFIAVDILEDPISEHMSANVTQFWQFDALRFWKLILFGVRTRLHERQSDIFHGMTLCEKFQNFHIALGRNVEQIERVEMFRKIQEVGEEPLKLTIATGEVVECHADLTIVACEGKVELLEMLIGNCEIQTSFVEEIWRC